jgi:hypothetical protein
MVEKADRLAILSPICGLVTKEIPRFPKKLEEVKTQKVSDAFEEHVGSDVHGLGATSYEVEGVLFSGR